MPWARGLMETRASICTRRKSRGLAAGRRSIAPRQGSCDWATDWSSEEISLSVWWTPGVKDSYAGGLAKRTECVKIQRKWCAGACLYLLEEGTVCLFSQFHIQWHNIDNLKRWEWWEYSLLTRASCPDKYLPTHHRPEVIKSVVAQGLLPEGQDVCCY